MVDHYNNLTLKSMLTLKYFVNSSNFKEPRPQYLVKADEDSYLNLPFLWQTLNKMNVSTRLLMGSRFNKPKRQPVAKAQFLHLPSWLFAKSFQKMM